MEMRDSLKPKKGNIQKTASCVEKEGSCIEKDVLSKSNFYTKFFDHSANNWKNFKR